MNGHPYVRAETHQFVTTIEFYHPKSNSLPSELLQQLAREINKAATDYQANVIVLRSAGTRAFCAGASFEELASIRTEAEGTKFFGGFANVINAMRLCPKLIIGRIHGKCVGGGVGIAAAVDYALALDSADIKLSELSIGIGPFVVAPIIEKKIGTAAFGQLAIDSSLWRNAEWARKKGLFAELHSSTESLDEAVSRLAGTLAHSHADAMAEIKKELWKDTGHWDRLLSERAAISGRLALSEFAQHAIKKQLKY